MFSGWYVIAGDSKFDYGFRFLLDLRAFFGLRKITAHHKMNWYVLGFGTALALIDLVMMPIAKLVSVGKLPLWTMGIATILYAADPWIFLRSLNVEGMAVMNLVWNLVSNVLVTLFGLVVMEEKVSTMKKIGVALSFVCIYLLSAE